MFPAVAGIISRPTGLAAVEAQKCTLPPEMCGSMDCSMRWPLGAEKGRKQVTVSPDRNRLNYMQMTKQAHPGSALQVHVPLMAPIKLHSLVCALGQPLKRLLSSIRQCLSSGICSSDIGKLRAVRCGAVPVDGRGCGVDQGGGQCLACESRASTHVDSFPDSRSWFIGLQPCDGEPDVLLFLPVHGESQGGSHVVQSHAHDRHGGFAFISGCR